MAVSFRLLAEEGGARRGQLETAHGVVDTPAFMPVGTQATVKALAPDEVRGLGRRSCWGTPTTWPYGRVPIESPVWAGCIDSWGGTGPS